jgi:hypothetical protein
MENVTTPSIAEEEGYVLPNDSVLYGFGFAGQSKEDLRKYARSAFDLANNLQHRRTATFRDAAICAEATVSLANLLSIVAGRRDPPA